MGPQEKQENNIFYLRGGEMIKLGRMLIKVIEVHSEIPPRVEAEVNISD